jgi:hypothetical protein
MGLDTGEPIFLHAALKPWVGGICVLEVRAPVDAMASRRRFAVHRRPHRLRVRRHEEALLFELEQRVDVDRLDLGDDGVRPLPLDHGHQRPLALHVDRVGPVGDLHARRVRVAVDRHDLNAHPLRLDHRLLSQLARAEKQELRPIRIGSP